MFVMLVIHSKKYSLCTKPHFQFESRLNVSTMLYTSNFIYWFPALEEEISK